MPADAGPAAVKTAADKNDRADGNTSDTEDSVIAGERAHLERSREFLHLMRENVLTLAQNPMAGDRVSLEYLKADLYRRAEALKDLPDAPLFFGRLDYSELARDEDEDFAGRRLPHRTAPRARHGRHPGRPRLAGPGVPALLPGQPVRPDGPHAAAAVRLRRGSAHRLRRRAVLAATVKPAPVRRIHGSARQQPAHFRDRAAAVRPDARHRGHDPAGAGRHRPRRRRHHRLRAGRARHGEDRGGPAPGRVPAVRAQGAGDAARRDRRRPEPGLPLLHQERPARPRRA